MINFVSGSCRHVSSQLLLSGSGCTVNQLRMHWILAGGEIVGGTTSERKIVAIWIETRMGKTCKTNFRICSAERREG